MSTNRSDALYGSYGWTNTLKGVYYGPGSLQTALPKLLGIVGGTKALIVTGRSLHEKTDIVKKVEDLLQAHNAYGGTFWEIGEHTPIAGIKQGIKKLSDVRADVIVSVGGGSPIDASKAIIYNIQQATGGKFLPQIAIPTTLSAAEYTIGAGFTNEEGHKVAVSAQELAPAGIILDAELTLATPEKLWLSTGIRALDHAVENLYRDLVPAPIKALCYAALADLFKYLPESKANPSAVDVRQKLQIAAWMSLWPLKLERYSALGLSHSLGHKLGATYGIPHGITSCITLAPVVKLQASIASPEHKQCLADALFYLRVPSTGSVDDDIVTLSGKIDELVRNLGLHSTLQDYRVPKENIAQIAKLAVGDDQSAVYQQVIKLLEGVHQ